jgi:hypothetical protein
MIDAVFCTWLMKSMFSSFRFSQGGDREMGWKWAKMVEFASSIMQESDVTPSRKHNVDPANLDF